MKAKEILERYGVQEHHQDDIAYVKGVLERVYRDKVTAEEERDHLKGGLELIAQTSHGSALGLARETLGLKKRTK